MTAREAVNKLKEIRFQYETGQLDMATANQMGKQYVEIFNKFAKETAKKYGIKRNTTIPNNVKFYPNR